jgi:hypothetical protein
MFKSYFGRNGQAAEEARALAEAADALKARMGRFLHASAARTPYEPESQLPSGAGTVSRAALLAKAGRLQAARSAA